MRVIQPVKTEEEQKVEGNNPLQFHYDQTQQEELVSKHGNAMGCLLYWPCKECPLRVIVCIRTLQSLSALSAKISGNRALFDLTLSGRINPPTIITRNNHLVILEAGKATPQHWLQSNDQMWTALPSQWADCDTINHLVMKSTGHLGIVCIAQHFDGLMDEFESIVEEKYGDMVCLRSAKWMTCLIQALLNK